jgi:hypothetical protein
MSIITAIMVVVVTNVHDWRGHGQNLGGSYLYDQIGMASNIPEMIVMIRHILVSESRTVLRTMLSAAALADAAPAAGDAGAA